MDSIGAWNVRYGLANVANRHSQAFTSNEVALATWLRLGETEAEMQECADYSKTRFTRAVRSVRRLTREPIDEALQQTVRLCNKAGVALALIRPLPKTALSGAYLASQQEVHFC